MSSTRWFSGGCHDGVPFVLTTVHLVAVGGAAGGWHRMRWQKAPSAHTRSSGCSRRISRVPIAEAAPVDYGCAR